MNLQTVIAYCVAHWAVISGAILLILATLKNRNVGGPAAQTIWDLLIDLVSLKPQPGAQVKMLGGSHAVPAKWKLPVVMVSHHSTLPGAPGIASLLFLFVAASLISGCATCKLPANAGRPECKIENVVVQCSVPAVVRTAENILPEVIAALAGQTIDWTALVKLEEQVGIEAVACAIAAADKQATGVGALPTLFEPGISARIHQHAGEALAKMRVAVR